MPAARSSSRSCDETELPLRSRSVRPDDGDAPRRTRVRSHHRTRRRRRRALQPQMVDQERQIVRVLTKITGPSRMVSRDLPKGNRSPRSAGTITSKCRASARASGKSSFQLPARPGTRTSGSPRPSRTTSTHSLPIRTDSIASCFDSVRRGSSTKSATSPLAAWCFLNEPIREASARCARPAIEYARKRSERDRQQGKLSLKGASSSFCLQLPLKHLSCLHPISPRIHPCAGRRRVSELSRTSPQNDESSAPLSLNRLAFGRSDAHTILSKLLQTYSF